MAFPLHHFKQTKEQLHARERMAVKLERKQKLGKVSECVPSSTYSSVIPFAFRSYPPSPPKKEEKRNRGCPQEKNGREGNKILLLLLLSAFSISAGSHIQRNICEGEGSAQAVFHSLFSAELVEGGGMELEGGINHNFGLI